MRALVFAPVFRGAVKAVLVVAQIGEGFGVVDERPGDDFGILEAGGFGEGVGGTELALGEEAVFDGFDAPETPLRVGDDLGEFALDRVFGFEAGDDFGAEALEFVLVFGGQEDRVARQSVFCRVLTGGGFAFGGCWACGALRVGLVGG